MEDENNNQMIMCPSSSDIVFLSLICVYIFFVRETTVRYIKNQGELQNNIVTT